MDEKRSEMCIRDRWNAQLTESNFQTDPRVLSCTMRPVMVYLYI